MDTDDLSQEAYKAIIIEAEKFNHDLTLQFGLMADSCKNEKEYILQAKILVKEIMGLNKADLTDLFFDKPPTKKSLDVTLNKILSNITEVEKIPENKRHYDF